MAASWVVQVGIDIYRFFSGLFKDDNVEVDKAELVQLIGKKVYGTTVRCGASLVFASIGAGIGATLFRPSAGQWIGKRITCLVIQLFNCVWIKDSLRNLQSEKTCWEIIQRILTSSLHYMHICPLPYSFHKSFPLSHDPNLVFKKYKLNACGTTNIYCIYYAKVTFL